MRISRAATILLTAMILAGCAASGNSTKLTKSAPASEPAVDPATAEAHALKIIKTRGFNFVWHFGDSVTISLNGPEWQTDSIAQLQYVRNLGGLEICCPCISKDGLRQIARLTSIHRLVLEGPTTDADMAELVKMKQLERLHLGASRITDKGLALLTGLPHLGKLTLDGCGRDGEGVTQAGIQRLRDKGIWVVIPKR